MINISVPIPDGFTPTGEYRKAEDGDYALAAGGGKVYRAHDKMLAVLK